MQEVYDLLLLIISNITEKLTQGNTKAYHQEDVLMILHRWEKIKEDFKHPKTGTFNISKIPDIFDCAKYDSLYNYNICNQEVKSLYDVVTQIANMVVRQEYGITDNDKLQIARGYMKPLMQKIGTDLHANTAGHRLYNIIYIIAMFFDVCGCRFLQYLRYMKIFFQTEKNDKDIE